MQTLTFLSAKNRLVKTFKADGTKSFPLSAKNLTSEAFDIEYDAFEDKAELIRIAASKGQCLLKGNLKRGINNESRAGLTDRVATTRTLVLDFDGIKITGLPSAPYNKEALTIVAEKLISKLPEEFHNCSYIAHASSSMGMKKDIASMHLEFTLDAAIAPKMLKQYLYLLNFQCLEEQLKLNPSGFSLKWIIDPALADNTRLIYIAHPNFEDGITNPIPEDRDRIFAVIKEVEFLNTEELTQQINVPELDQKRKDKIASERKKLGLRKMEIKTSPLKIDGRDVEVNTRPEALQMTFAYENGPFVYYNINGGDSNAYYVKKSNPDVVFNFKGEEPFLFAIADKEMHEWHKEQFPPTDSDGNSMKMPICWRDREADTLYTAFWEPTEKRLLELVPGVSAANIPDFFRDFGYEAPDVMPQYICAFRPDIAELFNPDKRWVNTFQPTDVMFNPPVIQEELKNLEYPEIFKALEVVCPLSAKVIKHALGGLEHEVVRFINWLGFTFQKKCKTGTAWVIHGTQGTGKGLLFEKILAPILNRYARKVNPKDLFDLSNTWHSESLIVFVDENKEKKGASADEEYNLIKNMITEESGTVRAMFSNQKQGHFFANFIFTSNELDAIRIPDNDRRFNVATRQEKALLSEHPEFKDQKVVAAIADEAPKLYALLNTMQVDVDAARTPIENGAKNVMRLNTKSTIEEFITAIKRGDFDFFIDILTSKAVTSQQFEIHSTARKTLLEAIKHMQDNQDHKIETTELMVLYQASTSDKGTTSRKFTKMLRLNGLEPSTLRINKTSVRGLSVSWKPMMNSPEILAEMYLDQPTIGVVR